MIHKHTDHHKHRLHHRKILLAAGVGIAFVVGLVIAVFAYNMIERGKNNNLEVTFVTPRQAVIFWKTEKPGVGYVTYGPSAYDMTGKAEQTSSVASDTHAVVIDDVPTEGMYIQLHSDTDSRFYWPEKTRIEFDPTTIE